MNRLLPALLILVLACEPAFAAARQPVAKGSALEVLEIQFQPVGQGKNFLSLTVRNTSKQQRTFAVHIQSRSPHYGNLGWGTAWFEPLGPQETNPLRFGYVIHGPATDRTWVRLRFYDLAGKEDFDFEQHLRELKYFGPDLVRRAPQAEPRPASAEQAANVEKGFVQVQSLLRDKDYNQAWKALTKDCQKLQFLGFKYFERAMEAVGPESMFWPSREDLLDVEVHSIGERNGVFVLTARSGGPITSIDLVRDRRKWKIDWISFTPRRLRVQRWRELLLPQMQKRATEHFDIYYFKDSTAEREIARIAEQRETAYQQICEFLGRESAERMRLVLFEDMETKLHETGHQGLGWATGDTMVEVFNKAQKLDPYHELTHILAGSVGNPPAALNEGLAVYMSERLGAPPLEDLGGGQARLYQRVRQLKANGDWIPLEELLTYTEIGSERSRPPVAYAQAGSFVKFLVDSYGREKFLQAYKTLRNSDEPARHQANVEALERIYDLSLQQLDERWHTAFQPAEP